MPHSNNEFKEILRGQIAYANSLIAKKSWNQLEKFLHTIDSHEVASIIQDLDPTSKILVFRILSEKMAIDTFTNLDREEQEKLLLSFTDTEAGAILVAMDPDDRTRFLGDLPPVLVTQLLKLLPMSERKIANTLLDYPEDSAGRIMTPEFVALSPDLIAYEAVRLLKEQASQKETIYTSFIVDDKGVLIGSVTLEDLILAPDKKKLKDFMKENPISSSTHADQEEIAHLINYYELMVLPITDMHNRLVGIVTSDDIIDVIQEEVTEDFHRFTGISPNEVSYLTGSIWSLIVSRSGWVLVLLFVAGFAQDFIVRYGELLEQYWIELSLFFTILVGAGGNVGSQSSILVIRGITTGEITSHDVGRLISRAILSGIAMGVLLGGMLLLRITVFKTGESVKWIASLSMCVIVIISNLLGAILPLILKKYKVDPAIVSAPLITTLMDVGGIVIYLEIARALLKT